MIHLLKKSDCCGCSACVQRCPRQCIILEEDIEGFLYPIIDETLCIDCGLCEKVCPVINQNEAREPLRIFAAINQNEDIRLNSSSGGLFTLFGEKIIDEGGVVFGVGFNHHWEAVHYYVETKEELSAFRMSKYVQSIIGDSYKDTEKFLKKGRLVLYSGTPCQIAGLKKFLRKDYPNLLTVDFICHGTPSPGVFRWYISEELSKVAYIKSSKRCLLNCSIPNIPKSDIIAKELGLKIRNIKFRDKCLGWKRFSFTLELERHTLSNRENCLFSSYTLDQNAFLKGFLKDLYLRPSCYNCPTKNLKSNSDITIGDYWGINTITPNWDDDKGTSAILINTIKGKVFWNRCVPYAIETDYTKLCNLNPALLRNPIIPKNRKNFFKADNLSFHEKITKLCRKSIKELLKEKLKLIIKK